MEAFCETVSQGKVCQIQFGQGYSMCVCIDGDKSPPRGLPEVPMKWAKAVLPKMASGAVVESDDYAKASAMHSSSTR